MYREPETQGKDSERYQSRYRVVEKKRLQSNCYSIFSEVKENSFNEREDEPPPKNYKAQTQVN